MDTAPESPGAALTARTPEDVVSGRSPDGNDDLRARAVRGTAFTLVGQWSGVILQLLSAAVLARLLLPADYGLIGMVLPIIGIAELLRDLGLSDATIQSRTLTHAQVSTLFWLNLAVGVAGAAMLVLLAPAFASFYGREEVRGLTYFLAPTLVFGSLAAQQAALMTRHLRFGALTTGELIAQAIGVLAGIASAFAGAKYWSLAVMSLVTAASRAALYWRVSGWRPGRPSRGSGIRKMLAFGVDVSLFQTLNYLSRNLDNVILGRAAGEAELGLYSRAYGLFLLPLQRINRPISRVAAPTLARLQDDPVRYRRYYLRGISVISLVSMPIMVALAVLAPEVVEVVLGKKWLGVVPVFRVLAVCGVTQVISFSNGWLYASTGQVRRQLKWGMISRPFIIISFFIGVPWGGLGVAAAYTIANYILLPFAFHNALKGTPVSSGQLLSVTWRPAVLTAVMAVAVFAGQALTQSLHAVATLAVATVVGGCTYAATALAWPALRREVLATSAIFRRSPRSGRPHADPR